MIQHRISKTLKKIETITESIEHFKNQKKLEEENFTNLISSFMQKCHDENDEESISSLVRYLYWYTDIKGTKIQEYTGIDNRAISKRAGVLIFSAVCTRCQSQFASKRTSRSDLGETICQSCINADVLESHKIFLEDWTGAKWVNQNPKMEKGTYLAYLHSAHWKQTRTKALQNAGYKCQACSSKDDILDVHHNTYERLGNEDELDLIVLCRSCHGKIHGK